jgi:intracellular sulfur oxidation DsrE/DsrF family protein
MIKFFPIVILLISSNIQAADLPGFGDGPLIKGYGKHASVSSTSVDSSDAFSVAFDVAKGAEPGQINRQFDSLARFLNMHAAAGVPKENLKLALVVHGRAGIDLLDEVTYTRVQEQSNANILLLKELMRNNVQVILCGQTAKAYSIEHDQLIEGVRVELSAMTAHALLQQQGYTVNPF